MWTREGLKTNTKAMLRVNYWKIFLVLFIFGIISNGPSYLRFSVDNPFKDIGSAFSSGASDNNNFLDEFNNEFNTDGNDYYDDSPSVNETFDFWGLGMAIAGVVLVIILIALAIGFVFTFFLINPLQVGTKKAMLNYFKNQGDFGDIGYSFKSGRYMSVVKAQALKDVYLILWTMLFIIPGIVKGYSYRMVPFILADNPNIGTKRAIDLSRKMTDGEKFDMFVLDLSFIGWYILGFFACGIGILFVNPYYESTVTNLYMVLRDKAIMTGISTYEELGFARPGQENGNPGQSFGGQGFYPGASAYQPPVNPYWPGNGQPPMPPYGGQGQPPVPPYGQPPMPPYGGQPQPPVPPFNQPPVVPTEPEAAAPAEEPTAPDTVFPEITPADTEMPASTETPSYDKPDYEKPDFEKKDDEQQ